MDDEWEAGLEARAEITRESPAFALDGSDGAGLLYHGVSFCWSMDVGTALGACRSSHRTGRQAGICVRLDTLKQERRCRHDRGQDERMHFD